MKCRSSAETLNCTSGVCTLALRRVPIYRAGAASPTELKHMLQRHVVARKGGQRSRIDPFLAHTIRATPLQSRAAAARLYSSYKLGVGVSQRLILTPFRDQTKQRTRLHSHPVLVVAAIRALRSACCTFTTSGVGGGAARRRHASFMRRDRRKKI